MKALNAAEKSKPPTSAYRKKATGQAGEKPAHPDGRHMPQDGIHDHHSHVRSTAHALHGGDHFGHHRKKK